MNRRTGTLTRVEARGTIGDRRRERPHLSVEEFSEAAERRRSTRMLPDTVGSFEQWVDAQRAAMARTSDPQLVESRP